LISETPITTSYDFIAPARIVFGWGRWTEIGPLAAQLGRRAFLVMGSRTLRASGVVDQLRELLQRHHVELVELANISDEPQVADVDRAVQSLIAQEVRPGDLVIGLGGGSALDLAKAVAALATNRAGATVRDYLEGVGRGCQIVEAPLPMLALPTTAGTGSEATKNAVISSYEPPFKKSLRSDGMMPRAVIIDPQWAVTVPPAITAQTGMDAITQLIESYISRKARPIPQDLAVGGLRLAMRYLPEAVENGQSRPAREAMAQAALLSGLALANSGLGMAHGVAAALGVHFRMPHGLACAIMLPVALRTNLPVCRTQLGELAQAVGIGMHLSCDGAAEALIERIESIGQQVGVPRRLSDVGVRRGAIADLVRDSRGNSMDGNPRTLSDQELADILETLL